MKRVPVKIVGRQRWDEILVDDELFTEVSSYRWYWRRGFGFPYAFVWSGGARFSVRVHELVLGEPRSGRVLARNGNVLDARRANLRVERFTSQYRGVSRLAQREARKPWVAVIDANGEEKNLGAFATEREAALAYNAAAFLSLGNNAILNKL